MNVISSETIMINRLFRMIKKSSLWDDNKKSSQRDDDDESSLWDNKKIIPFRMMMMNHPFGMIIKKLSLLGQ